MRELTVMTLLALYIIVVLELINIADFYFDTSSTIPTHILILSELLE
jgi:hypothetical protein